MKLTLTQPRFIKDSILIINELVNEVNLKITKDYIELIAMDPANVAMVIFKLLSSAFSEYDVDEEKILGINLNSFTQLLKRVKPSDILTMELDEDRNRLNVILKGTSVRKFDLALLDIEHREQKIPNLTFDANVKTNNLLFNEAIEDMDVISDSLSLQIADGSLFVKGEGSLSSGKVEITPDQETEIEGSEAKSKYSVEYLKKMIKGSKLANEVYLHFGNDYPLKMEYRLVDRLSLVFILAPRVSTD